MVCCSSDIANLLITVIEIQAYQEPQRGLGKHSCHHVGPQTFLGGPSGKKICEFFFSKWCTRVYFIFQNDSGAPKRRGAQSCLSPSPPSRWAC